MSLEQVLSELLSNVPSERERALAKVRVASPSLPRPALPLMQSLEALA